MKKKFSIVTPCYNEEKNLRNVYDKISTVMAGLSEYDYEHIFIDNSSTDTSVAILRELAAGDKRVKVILNSRNFGHIRSPYYGMLNAFGDAVILLVADLQDPPELIPELVKKWEEGFESVVCTKRSSEENWLMFGLRKIYYYLVNKLSNMELIQNFTGFGLYDRKVMDALRKIRDPYPYFRGMVSEIGYRITKVPYDQPKRKKGKTKNNFYTLYDIAMLGLTNYSKIPLRIATIFGFTCATGSLLVALGYLVLKIWFWNSFSFGIGPIVIGMFFLFSVQLFFLGIVGEYIASIHTQVLDRPLVIERERINF